MSKEQRKLNFLTRILTKSNNYIKVLPCCVDRLLLELIVIDGFAEVFELKSCEFPSPDS